MLMTGASGFEEDNYWNKELIREIKENNISDK